MKNMNREEEDGQRHHLNHHHHVQGKKHQGGGCDPATQNHSKEKWEQVGVVDNKDMWFEKESGGEHLLDVADAFISYDDFPPLPDFPCISSSSSSSCSSAPFVSTKPDKCSSASSSSSSTFSANSSSSSAASWAVVKQNIGGQGQVSGENTNLRRYHRQQDEYLEMDGGDEQQAFLSSASTRFPEIDRMDSDCMHVMEELGDMDLFDTNDIWDPSSVFPYEQDQDQQQQNQNQDQFLMMQQQQQNQDQGNNTPSEDLAMLFFEWLKSNKESISAEDLRSIKLKRSTIECAVRRLGGGKEGMKQLLKLILEWVQNHQLQKKRSTEGAAGCVTQQDYNPDTNFNNTFIPDAATNPYMMPTTIPQWSPPPHMFPPMGGYMGDQPSVFANAGVGAPFH